MPSKSAYRSAGLLSGAGTALREQGQQATARRYEKERIAAEDIRQRSLMSFQQGLNLENKQEQRKSDAGLLTESRGYKEGEDAKVVSNTRNLPGGKAQDVNKYGDDVGDPYDRTATSAEVSAANAKLKAENKGGRGKFDSAADRTAKTTLFTNHLRSHIAELEAETNEKIDFNNFMTLNADGTTTFNRETISSQFSPELYQELLDKSMLVEQGLQDKGLTPSEAVRWSDMEFTARSDKQEGLLNQSRVDATAKRYDTDAAVITNLSKAKATPAKAAELLAKKSQDPAGYSKAMEILYDVNLPLFDEISRLEEEKRVQGVTTGDGPITSSADYLQSIGKEPLKPQGYQGDSY
jgi:hypothetical protein